MGLVETGEPCQVQGDGAAEADVVQIFVDLRLGHRGAVEALKVHVIKVYHRDCSFFSFVIWDFLYFITAEDFFQRRSVRDLQLQEQFSSIRKVKNPVPFWSGIFIIFLLTFVKLVLLLFSFTIYFFFLFLFPRPCLFPIILLTFIPDTKSITASDGIRNENTV